MDTQALLRRHSYTELLALGHVYYGNAASANCLVMSLPLEADQRTITSTARVIFRVRVRPCNIEHKPFVLQRIFDMDELRSTIPDPTATPSCSATVELLSLSTAKQIVPIRKSFANILFSRFLLALSRHLFAWGAED